MWHWRMKSKPENTSEYTAFEQALGIVLKVSHSDIQERLKTEKEKKARIQESSLRLRFRRALISPSFRASHPNIHVVTHRDAVPGDTIVSDALSYAILISLV